MFSLKSRAARAGALAAVLATGGTAPAQDPAGPTSPPVPVSTAPVVPDAQPGVPGVLPPQPGAPAAGPGTPAPILTPQEGAPAKPAPQTWHGYPMRTLPLALPGAFPIAPSGPGYYTLLDQIRDTPGQGPPRFANSKVGPTPLPFFDTNFTYLDNIPFEDRDWAEKMKRVPVGEHWLFSSGGEIRERDTGGSNVFLSGKTSDSIQSRIRLYGDLWYEDIFRIYAEGYVAGTSGTTNPPQPRDVNTVDFLNLFVDLKVFSLNDNPVYARVGRQELNYGSQRLISTNDYANNRPRYDGAKLLYRSSDWDVDLFAVRPVIQQPEELGHDDVNRFFSGVWATYKPKQGTYLDLYYLNLNNDTLNVATGRNGVKGDYNVSTVGSRYTGRGDNGFLWDFEGAVQFGRWANQSIIAGMADVYVGWNFKDCALNPTIWAGYDYASGGSDRGGTHSTFNQLFNFGHYYSALHDEFGRQNMQDFNVQGYIYPTKWWLAGLQVHYLQLASSKDALYNYAGAVERAANPSGSAGKDVGTFITPCSNFHLTNRQDIFVTYTHFFPGTYITRTPGAKTASDGVYVQYSIKW